MAKDMVLAILADLKRVRKNGSIASFISALLFNHSFKYLFWFRIGNYCHKNIIARPFFMIVFFVIRRLSYKFGIQMPFGTSVGKGTV
jgi:serine acetyltransferase